MATPATVESVVRDRQGAPASSAALAVAAGPLQDFDQADVGSGSKPDSQRASVGSRNCKRLAWLFGGAVEQDVEY